MDVDLDRDRFEVFAPDLSKAVADLATETSASTAVLPKPTIDENKNIHRNVHSEFLLRKPHGSGNDRLGDVGRGSFGITLATTIFW